MARHYGVDYAKAFVDELYESLYLMNKGKEKLYSYYDDDYQNELTSYLLQSYINSTTVFAAEYHINPKGFSLSKENFEMIIKNKELYQKFVNLNQWYDKFTHYSKTNHSSEFNALVNVYMGWHSLQQNYYMNHIELPSFILFYKIKNRLFNCEADKEYLESIDSSKRALEEFIVKYNVSISDKEYFEKVMSFLAIKNIALKDDETITNPLKFQINCKKG